MQESCRGGVDAEEEGAATIKSEHTVAGEKNLQRRRCLIDARISMLCRETPDE